MLLKVGWLRLLNICLLMCWVCLMKLLLWWLFIVSRLSVVKLLSICVSCGCSGGWLSIVRLR